MRVAPYTNTLTTNENKCTTADDHHTQGSASARTAQRSWPDAPSKSRPTTAPLPPNRRGRVRTHQLHHHDDTIKANRPYDVVRRDGVNFRVYSNSTDPFPVCQWFTRPYGRRNGGGGVSQPYLNI